MEVAITAAGLAVAVYVTVSLLTPREAFDLDRMLHRGRYAPPGEPVVVPLPLRERFRVKNILQFDVNFTFSDKLVSGGIFWWAMFLLVVNVVVSVWNLFVYDWPISWWSKYWLVAGVGVPFVIALATLVWFGVGGIKDIFIFFHDLRTMDRDVHDNGTVRGAAPGGPGGFPVKVVDGAMPAPATNSPAAPIAPTPEGDVAVKTGAAVSARPVV
jgi:SSS family solute:Na+ symporter